MAAAGEECAAAVAGQKISLVIVEPSSVVFATCEWGLAKAAAISLQDAADCAWFAGGAKIPGVKREPFEVVVVQVTLEDARLPWRQRMTADWDTYVADSKKRGRENFPWK